MVIDGTAYACLSDDMDLFVHGCPRVLRYLDMVSRKMLLYNLNTILYTLELTLEEFRNICILAGTDYSPTKRSKTFHYYYNLFKKFKNEPQNEPQGDNFYLWLHQHQLLSDSVENSKKISKMFDISTLSIPTIPPPTFHHPQNYKTITRNIELYISP